MIENNNMDENIGQNIHKNNINNNKENIDYKSLEQRVLLLERELIQQQNMHKNIETMNRGNNYYPYNTQQNLNIFQNETLSEKVRPLSVKNSSINSFDKFRKNKMKKRKTKMKSIEDGQKKGNTYKIKNNIYIKLYKDYLI